MAYIFRESREVDLQHRLVRLVQDTVRNGIFVVAQGTHDGSTGAHILVRGVFDHHRTMGKEAHLLRTLCLQRREVLAMLGTDIGNDAYRWADDAFKPCHLARLGDTCLEDSQVGLLVHLPNGQRHTNLRVVRLRRAGNGIVLAQ